MFCPTDSSPPSVEAPSAIIWPVLTFSLIDTNLDGTVNISDVVILVDEILFGSYITTGDINADGINNINDIMLLIQIILI